jgi:hypothetical protein
MYEWMFHAQPARKGIEDKVVSHEASTTRAGGRLCPAWLSVGEQFLMDQDRPRNASLSWNMLVSLDARQPRGVLEGFVMPPFSPEEGSRGRG